MYPTARRLDLTENIRGHLVTDPEQLGWLLSYSPYHHVREGVLALHAGLSR
jgi:hypothetical protein